MTKLPEPFTVYLHKQHPASAGWCSEQNGDFTTPALVTPYDPEGGPYPGDERWETTFDSPVTVIAVRGMWVWAIDPTGGGPLTLKRSHLRPRKPKHEKGCPARAVTAATGHGQPACRCGPNDRRDVDRVAGYTHKFDDVNSVRLYHRAEDEEGVYRTNTRRPSDE